MGVYYTEAEAQTIRGYVRARKRQRDRMIARALEQARKDCDRVVAAIARSFDPLRIYVWGSLVEKGRFSPLSDIDIAVEGITDPAAFSALLVEAAEMSRFEVDIVLLEHAHADYAGYIRRRGVIAHERGSRARG